MGTFVPWEDMVPAMVAEINKAKNLFGLAARTRNAITMSCLPGEDVTGRASPCGQAAPRADWGGLPAG
jgi:hypothetical protein